MKRGGGRRYYRPDDIDLLRGIRHLLYGEGYTIRGAQRILKDHGIKFVQNVWKPGAAQPARGPAPVEEVNFRPSLRSRDAAAASGRGERAARRCRLGAPAPARSSALVPQRQCGRGAPAEESRAADTEPVDLAAALDRSSPHAAGASGSPSPGLAQLRELTAECRSSGRRRRGSCSTLVAAAAQSWWSCRLISAQAERSIIDPRTCGCARSMRARITIQTIQIRRAAIRRRYRRAQNVVVGTRRPRRSRRPRIEPLRPDALKPACAVGCRRASPDRPRPSRYELALRDQSRRLRLGHRRRHDLLLRRPCGASSTWPMIRC